MIKCDGCKKETGIYFHHKQRRKEIVHQVGIKRKIKKDNYRRLCRHCYMIIAGKFLNATER